MTRLKLTDMLFLSPASRWLSLLCLAVFLQGCQSKQDPLRALFSESSDSSYTEMSATCALAVSTAVDDLRTLIRMGDYLGYPGFNEFFVETYEVAVCSEGGDRVTVFVSAPINPELTGGGITGGVEYIIDAKTYVVLDRNIAR